MNFPIVFLAAAVAATPAPILAEDVAADLAAYHAQRVDEAHRHESESDRLQRMRWIADGYMTACEALPFDVKLGWTFSQCLAMGLTAAKWESGLLVEVHSGERRGPAGERCLAQLHRFVSAVPDAKYRITPEELASTTGLDAEATARCARAGVKALAWHIHRCRLRGDDFVAPAELFAEYHRPSINCTATLTKMNSDRARSYRAQLARLEKR